jgi:deazaflavin-dependent oxidoreductase (nitroreductase family)
MTLEGTYAPTRRTAVREQVELYEGSGGTEGTTLRGYPVVILTTVGVRSGALRKNPLMRVEQGGEYCVVASLGGAPRHPDWYRNAKANPLVELQDRTAKREMRSRELGGAERELWWGLAVEAFPDYAEYQAKTTRVIPLLLLTATDWGDR